MTHLLSLLSSSSLHKSLKICSCSIFLITPDSLDSTTSLLFVLIARMKRIGEPARTMNQMIAKKNEKMSPAVIWANRAPLLRPTGFSLAAKILRFSKLIMVAIRNSQYIWMIKETMNSRYGFLGDILEISKLPFGKLHFLDLTIMITNKMRTWTIRMVKKLPPMVSMKFLFSIPKFENRWFEGCYRVSLKLNASLIASKNC